MAKFNFTNCNIDNMINEVHGSLHQDMTVHIGRDGKRTVIQKTTRGDSSQSNILKKMDRLTLDDTQRGDLVQSEEEGKNQETVGVPLQVNFSEAAAPEPIKTTRNTTTTGGEHSDDRFYHLKMDLKKLIKGDRLTEFKEALNAARQMKYSDEDLERDKSCLSVLKTLERLNTFSESNVDLLLHVANMNADEDEDNRWWTDVGDLLSSFKCGRHNN